MARLVGPAQVERMYVIASGSRKGQFAPSGTRVPLYAEEECETAADVQAVDGGALPIDGGIPYVVIGDDFNAGQFLFPDVPDPVVYTQVLNGPVNELHPDADALVDELRAQLAAVESDLSADIVASEGALRTDLVSKGGATKGDGQNPLRLRRPTLVVDRMFPNAQHDHQIVWVDETAKVAYAIGQDRCLRKSTWVTNNDEAISFGLRLSQAPAGKTWAGDGLFIRLPSGVLLMSEYDAGYGIWSNTKILRSTNDGASWSTVWTTPDPAVRLLGSQSIARDAVTGYLYLVEYASGATPATISIWRSVDDGANWSVWYTHNRAETNATGIIRHYHGTRWDPVSQRVYFSAGDTSPDAGIYRVSADGSTAEPVVLNKHAPQWTTAARTIDFMFFPTHIAWLEDGADPHLYRLARTEIGQATPAIERVAQINSTGWWTQNASADGSVWVASASNEVATIRYDDGVHLYAVTNNGANIDEIATASMPAGSSATSISGLAAGNGGGNAFWMRAHGFKVHPHTTYSAFQFRARLSWAADQLPKPTLTRRLYVPETRNWMAALVAGETLTFAHTRAPSSTTSLYILNMGLKVLSGTGTARLQAYNVTTSTEIMTWAGGQNWRRDSTQDTTEFFNRVACASGDQIEFRIIETSGVNPCTVSAFVVTGWGFPPGT